MVLAPIGFYNITHPTGLHSETLMMMHASRGSHTNAQHSSSLHTRTDEGGLLLCDLLVFRSQKDAFEKAGLFFASPINQVFGIAYFPPASYECQMMRFVNLHVKWANFSLDKP